MSHVVNPKLYRIKYTVDFSAISFSRTSYDGFFDIKISYIGRFITLFFFKHNKNINKRSLVYLYSLKTYFRFSNFVSFILLKQSKLLYKRISRRFRRFRRFILYNFRKNNVFKILNFVNTRRIFYSYFNLLRSGRLFFEKKEHKKFLVFEKKKPKFKKIITDKKGNKVLVIKKKVSALDRLNKTKFYKKKLKNAYMTKICKFSLKKFIKKKTLYSLVKISEKDRYIIAPSIMRIKNLKRNSFVGYKFNFVGYRKRRTRYKKKWIINYYRNYKKHIATKKQAKVFFKKNIYPVKLNYSLEAKRMFDKMKYLKEVAFKRLKLRFERYKTKSKKEITLFNFVNLVNTQKKAKKAKKTKESLEKRAALAEEAKILRKKRKEYLDKKYIWRRTKFKLKKSIINIAASKRREKFLAYIEEQERLKWEELRSDESIAFFKNLSINVNLLKLNNLNKHNFKSKFIKFFKRNLWLKANRKLVRKAKPKFLNHYNPIIFKKHFRPFDIKNYFLDRTKQRRSKIYMFKRSKFIKYKRRKIKIKRYYRFLKSAAASRRVFFRRRFKRRFKRRVKKYIKFIKKCFSKYFKIHGKYMNKKSKKKFAKKYTKTGERLKIVLNTFKKKKKLQKKLVRTFMLKKLYKTVNKRLFNKSAKNRYRIKLLSKINSFYYTVLKNNYKKKPDLEDKRILRGFRHNFKKPKVSKYFFLLKKAFIRKIIYLKSWLIKSIFKFMSYRININIFIIVKKLWSSIKNSNMFADAIIIRLLKKNKIRDIIRSTIRYFHMYLYSKKIGGYSIIFSGRFTRKDRALHAWLKRGKYSRSNRILNLDYSNKRVALKYSSCSFKIILNRGNNRRVNKQM